MVDTRNISYSQARELLGIADEVVSGYTTTEQPAWAISLEDRALALEGIMSYLNKANQVNGGRIQLDNGGGRLREAYEDHAQDVQTGAEVNRDRLRPSFSQGIMMLAGVEQMRALGFDEDVIERERMRMQIEMNRKLGVGNAYAPARHKVAKTARQTADIVAGRKKPRRRGK